MLHSPVRFGESFYDKSELCLGQSINKKSIFHCDKRILIATSTIMVSIPHTNFSEPRPS